MVSYILPLLDYLARPEIASQFDQPSNNLQLFSKTSNFGLLHIAHFRRVHLLTLPILSFSFVEITHHTDLRLSCGQALILQNKKDDLILIRKAVCQSHEFFLIIWSHHIRLGNTLIGTLPQVLSYRQPFFQEKVVFLQTINPKLLFDCLHLFLWPQVGIEINTMNNFRIAFLINQGLPITATF